MGVNFERVCNKFFPLTHPQKRIWYIEKVYPDTAIYNIGAMITINGEINVQLLEKSIQIFIQNNECARIRIVEDSGEVRQFVAPYEEFNVDFIDFRIYEEPRKELEFWGADLIGKPFKLQEESLCYFAIFKTDNNEMGYLIKCHHIISDGWSLEVATKEIGQIYLSLCNNEPIAYKSEYSYFKYLSREEEYLSSKRFIRDRAFWKEKFKVLPQSFFDQGTDSIKGKRKSYCINEDLSNIIKNFI